MTIFLKLVFNLALINALVYATELESSSPTNWGEWQAYEYCPDGTFVFGMQLKTEQSQGAITDDTALNGLKFFCGQIHDQEIMGTNGTEIVPSAISSKSHGWGSWGKTFNFTQNKIAVGFQMRNEASGGWLVDDTAANNVRIICNEGNVLEGDGMDWGDWTAATYCPTKMAFCGLSTQIYYASGTDDETSMDRLRVKCCDVPNPAIACIPRDDWDLVIECDNLEAISPTSCTYQKKVGTSNYTSVSENHWDIVETYTNLGFSLGGIAGPLLANFHANLNISSSTGYDWTTSSSDSWSEEVTTTVSFEVPPRVKSQLFQIFGNCGIYGAKASRFKKVDKEADENGVFTQTVTYFDE